MTGTLIPERMWADLGHEFWQSMKDGKDDAMAEMLVAANVTSPDLAGYVPEFLHLSGAEIWRTTKDIDPSDDFPALWRGRLNRVDGFLIINQRRLAELKEVVGGLWQGSTT